jgi:hypothetical protein
MTFLLLATAATPSMPPKPPPPRACSTALKCWLERCILVERLCAPDEHAGVPLPVPMSCRIRTRTLASVPAVFTRRASTIHYTCDMHPHLHLICRTQVQCTCLTAPGAAPDAPTGTCRQPHAPTITRTHVHTPRTYARRSCAESSRPRAVHARTSRCHRTARRKAMGICQCVGLNLGRPARARPGDGPEHSSAS